MRTLLVVVALALGLFVLLGVLQVPAVYIYAPLVSLGIIVLGLGSLRSLQAPAAHVPTGDPEPIDPRREQVSYWCAGCGAELLLLVRGTASPPRHCGERMHERTEIPRDPGNGGR